MSLTGSSVTSVLGILSEGFAEGERLLEDIIYNCWTV